MPRLDYTRCKGCGRFAKDVGQMSHTRLCPYCSVERLQANISQMMARSGPNFDEWRRGMILCAGGEIKDNRLLSP